MKQLIFVFCLLFADRFCAQNNMAVSEVVANLEAQQKAWNRGDVRGFMEHYWHHDSLKFITSKKVTYGWQQTLDNYLRAYPDQEAMGRLTFSVLEVTALSDTAVYVIGKWTLLKQKPAGGHFTLMWRKLDGKWVIVSDHTS